MPSSSVLKTVPFTRLSVVSDNALALLRTVDNWPLDVVGLLVTLPVEELELEEELLEDEELSVSLIPYLLASYLALDWIAAARLPTFAP